MNIPIYSMHPCISPQPSLTLWRFYLTPNHFPQYVNAVWRICPATLLMHLLRLPHKPMMPRCVTAGGQPIPIDNAWRRVTHLPASSSSTSMTLPIDASRQVKPSLQSHRRDCGAAVTLFPSEPQLYRCYYLSPAPAEHPILMLLSHIAPPSICPARRQYDRTRTSGERARR